MRDIDFEEMFSPITIFEIVRLLLALSAKNGWEVHHLDVNLAFSKENPRRSLCYSIGGLYEK